MGGLDGCEEADAPEVDADHGDAGPEEPLQRTQHRPVPTEHDREVDRRRIGVFGAQQLDP